MSGREQPWSDEKVEALVGRLLQAGVLVATAVVLIGGVMYLARYGSAPPNLRVFHAEPDKFRTVGGVVRAAEAASRRGIIQLGLLLLVATPIARVILSAYAFARQRDYLYVGVTSVVLAVLLYSLLR